MIAELIDVALDAAESCAPCSGGNPSNMTWPGTIGSASDAGTPSRNHPGPDRAPADTENGDRSDSDRPGRERPDHEDENYERDLLVKNHADTIFNLVWEVVTHEAGGLGKVIAPLIPPMLGAEPLADGVANVEDADKIREDHIYHHTGGEMGTPMSDDGSAEGSRQDSAGGETDSGSQSESGHDSDSDEGDSRSEEAQRLIDSIRENVRIKEQIREAGNADWDGWKDWR